MFAAFRQRLLPAAVLGGLLLFVPAVFNAGAWQRTDEALISTALEERLQSRLNTLVGPERTMIQVEVTLTRPVGPEEARRTAALRRMPGVVGPREDPEGPAVVPETLTPSIARLNIVVWADERLGEDVFEQVRTEVARWAGIRPARGDTVRVVPMPWREIPAPPTALQQNYLFYSILALAALLILIAAIYFPLRKLKTPSGAVLPGAPGGEPGAGFGAGLSDEDRKRHREEIEELKQVIGGAGGDYGETLSEIRQLLEQGLPKASSQVDSILAEIKDILSRSPQESDDLLGQIRDTLSSMLEEQKKIATLGGGAGPGGAPTPGAAGPAAPAAGAPAGGVAGGEGGGFSPEVVEVLGNIEDLMAQQLEKTPDQSGLEEPFKYLKTLPPEDLVRLIEDEEAKLAAAVMAQIDPKAAGETIELLNEEKQLEIARAMTGLTESEDLAEEIKSFLERKLKIVRLHKDYTPVLGYRALADILSSSRYAVAKVILEQLAKSSPSISNEVRKRMFLFEDVVTLDNKDLEVVLHNVPREQISAAMADADEKVREKLFSAMTDRARKMIEEDLETFRRVELEKEGKELPFNEAIANIDQPLVEEIYRTADQSVLKMAIRGASQAVQEKFFKSLTERAAMMLKEDLEVMGPIPRKRADEAQEEIMDILRKLSSRTLEAQHEIIATIRKLEHEGQISVERFQEEMV